MKNVLAAELHKESERAEAILAALRIAITEGIKSGIAEDFNTQEHLNRLKSKKAGRMIIDKK